MKDLPEIIRNDQRRARWYVTEKNTAALVNAVLSIREAITLNGDDLWNLVRLCWTTQRPNRPKNAPELTHWKIYKAPALGNLVFKKQIKIYSDLNSTIDAVRFPKKVAMAARQRTGYVGFRNVWRNSSLKWCRNHAPVLRRMIAAMLELTREDDKQRLAIAAELDQLPYISSPRGKPTKHPAGFLTALLACLDPQGRFPMINGKEQVQDLLKCLSVGNADLTLQVKGMMNLIGHFGLSDSFMVDVLADEIAKLGSKLGKLRGEAIKDDEGSSLPYYDEAEREAVIKSESRTYRVRHDKMTNRLKQLFKWLELKRGKAANCRYDVLFKNYDADGRDLLVEVKPDPDKGSLRIAIGQLFDYRRFLPRQAATDLAVLTISQPPTKYIDLLTELQIAAIWFITDSLKKLDGKGQAWESLSKVLSKQ
jgi:hypothetical protein